MNRLRGIGVPGGIDELDQLDLIRRQEQALRAREAPLVRINPPGFRNGVIGGQQTITAGQRSIQIVNFLVDDQDALPFTVTLYPVITPDILGTTFANDFRPFATVRFGAMGAMTEVEVDVGRGCQFTAGGSSCTIEVGSDAGIVSGTQLQLPIAAMLSMWATSRQRPVYRTRYVGSLESGNTAANQTIPNFAQTLEIQRSLAAGVLAAVTVNMLDSTGVTRYSYVLGAGVQQTMPIALSDDVYFFNITNDSGGVINARLIFGLCL